MEKITQLFSADNEMIILYVGSIRNNHRIVFFKSFLAGILGIKKVSISTNHVSAQLIIVRFGYHCTAD